MIECCILALTLNGVPLAEAVAVDVHRLTATPVVEPADSKESAARSRRGRNIKLGAVAGALVGCLAGFLYDVRYEGDGDSCVALASLGTLAGGLIGSVIRSTALDESEERAR